MPTNKTEKALFREFRAEDIIAAFPIYIAIKGFSWIPYLARVIGDPSFHNIQQLFVMTSYMIVLALCFFIGKTIFKLNSFSGKYYKKYWIQIIQLQFILCQLRNVYIFSQELDHNELKEG